MQKINPYPSLFYKSNFQFTNTHIHRAFDIIENSLETNSHLEKGSAKSSVGNQYYAPHRDNVFDTFFSWAQCTAQKILEEWHIADPHMYYVGNSWINVHEASGETLPHNHGASGLSLVAYLRLPANSGFTEFRDPHYEFKSLSEHCDEQTNLKEFYPIYVEQNDVLFFPGWIMHKSGINLSSEKRVILSANFINFTTRPMKFGDL